MHRQIVRPIVVLFLLSNGGWALSSRFGQAQDRVPDCADYQKEVEGAAEVVGPEFLREWVKASGCLIEIIAARSESVISPEISAQDRVILTKATGALNIIVSDHGAEAITTIRSKDDLRFTSVLSFSVRSSDKNLRSNATIILGNTIDNNSICVPIDNLYDETYVGINDYWVNGRANLLAIVSVIAPWAVKENFKNIRRVLEYTENNVDKGNPNLQKTVEIIDRIHARLDLQETYGDVANKNSSLPEEIESCVSYKPKWAGSRLNYSP